MPKQELLKRFGPPLTVSATPDGELLNYVEELPWWNWKTIVVTVAKDRVVSFGSPSTATRGQAPSTINDVRVGMTREQVEAAMGRPSSVSAQNSIEYMEYVAGR